MITLEEAKKLKEGDTILFKGDEFKFIQLIKRECCPMMIATHREQPDSGGRYCNYLSVDFKYCTLPPKKKTYRPFTYEELCIHLGEKIEHNKKKMVTIIDRIVEENGKVSSDFRSPLMLNDRWHFISTGLPVGMEVEE
jgi:hypothetical protein